MGMWGLVGLNLQVDMSTSWGIEAGSFNAPLLRTHASGDCDGERERETRVNLRNV